MKIYKSYTLKNILNIFIFLLSLFILLIFSKDNFSSVKDSVSIFISSIIPSLFPFIFFTEFILTTDILNSIQNSTGKLFAKIFGISKKASPAIITGFLCGFPMGAKTVANLYLKGDISKKEAIKLLFFINNCNPAFILSTIGIGILYNIKLGILLAISHYLASIIIGIFFFRKSSLDIIHEKDLKLNTLNKNNYIKDKNIFEIIKKCIKNTFFTLSMILGFMILFNLLFSTISKFLHLLNVSENIISVVSGMFEVTCGISNVYNSSLSFDIKLLSISFLLGFSGLCIICQIYSTISEYNFSFKKLLISKFLHGILSMLITYIFIKYTNIFYSETINVYSSNDQNIREYYVSNMKLSYLFSTVLIISFLFIYYLIRKKVAHKNIGYKKEGG